MNIPDSTQKKELRRIIKDAVKNDGISTQSAIKDVVTDILHICDEHNLNKNDILKGAQEVYQEET